MSARLPYGAVTLVSDGDRAGVWSPPGAGIPGVMRRLLLCAVVLSLLAVPGAASAKVRYYGCNTGGQTPGGVDRIRGAGLSCPDVRTVIRRVEARKQFCRPQKDATIAPFRICDVETVLTAGTRTFHCVGRIETSTHFRETCTSRGGKRVLYRRNFNASGR